MILADLHLHSTFSDGFLDVNRLLELVYNRGVTLAALTDHDTIAGIGKALQVGRELGMEIITGVELSADFADPGAVESREVHILAYNFDCKDVGLLELLEWNRRSRHQRNLAILSRLKLLGLELDPEQLEGDGNPVGRPHLARQLVATGQVKSYHRVFAEYLGNGCKAWRPRQMKSVAEVCAVIREAGGLPVLAHPLKNLEFSELEQVVKMGLVGIEVAHPSQSQAEAYKLEEFARTEGLLLTGGSDFHGPGPYLRPDFDPASLLELLHSLRVNVK